MSFEIELYGDNDDEWMIYDFDGSADEAFDLAKSQSALCDFDVKSWSITPKNLTRNSH